MSEAPEPTSDWTIRGFFGTYKYLSNFYMVKITYEGIVYPSVEHAFQAAKTLDTGARTRIAGLMTPGEAKSVGTVVTLRENWEAIKYQVMLELVRQKFSLRLNSGLAKQLMSTGTAQLVETNNWHDNYWGSCTCAKCNDQGLNKLGEIVMTVRTELLEAVDNRKEDKT